MQIQWHNLTDFAKNILRKMDIIPYSDYTRKVNNVKREYEEERNRYQAYVDRKMQELTIQVHKLFSLYDSKSVYLLDIHKEHDTPTGSDVTVTNAKLTFLPYPISFKYMESAAKHLNYAEPVEFKTALRDLLVHELFVKHVPEIVSDLETQIDSWLESVNKEIKNVGNS